MRAATPALAVLLMLLLVPLGQAALVIRDASPVRGNHAMNPQLHCDIVFDAPGNAKCEVSGSIFAATHLRARIVGDASVHAYVFDRAGGRDIVTMDCAAMCLVKIPRGETTSTSVTLYVFAEGEEGSLVSVDIEKPLGLAGQ